MLDIRAEKHPGYRSVSLIFIRIEPKRERINRFQYHFPAQNFSKSRSAVVELLLAYRWTETYTYTYAAIPGVPPQSVHSSVQFDRVFCRLVILKSEFRRQNIGIAWFASVALGKASPS
jgi:hypothetical protein